MYRKFFVVIISFFILCGCSQKNVNTPTNSSGFAEENSNDFEDFEDEFSSISGGGFDPLSIYNRAMTTFNDAAMKNVIVPVAQGYQKVVPTGARDSISNFFHNLLYPIRLVNNLLQGKFANAAEETGRFIINTTVGFLGFADVATDIYSLDKHNEDFGQTLGYWGIPAGPHIVWPILGPSNLRDSVGMFADGWISPTSYVSSRDNINLVNTYFESILLKSFEGINELSRNPNMYETITKDAIDLYPLLKNMYEQRRETLIRE